MDILSEGAHDDQAGAEQNGLGEPDGYELVRAARHVPPWCYVWGKALGSGGCWLDPEPFERSLVPELVAGAVRTSRLATSLTVCRSGAACRDVSREFRAAGMDAAVYPSRTRYRLIKESESTFRLISGQGTPLKSVGNCKNFDQVERARALGLPPTAAVCLDCSFKRECRDPERKERGYLAELDAAGAAPHAVMSNARAEYTDLEEDCERREVVFFAGGHTLDVLRPTVRVKMDEGRAADLLAVIAKAAHRCCDETGFFQAVEELVRVFLTMVERCERGRVEVKEAGEPLRGWATKFNLAFGKQKPSPELKALVRVCTLNAAGKLDGPPSLTTLDGTVHVFASRGPRRFDQPVIVLDTEVSADEIAAATGDEYLTVVPPGTLTSPGVVQVAERTTEGKSAGRVAGIVRDHLSWTSGKLGVVSGKKLRHRAEITLCGGELERVVFADWYAGWDALRACDLTIVLGEPPVPDLEVMKRLFQTGRHDAMDRERGWVPRPWGAMTAEGARFEVQRRGYADEEWQDVRSAVKVGRLRQLLANLDGPAVVYSAEKLGMQVVPGTRLRKVICAFWEPWEYDRKYPDSSHLTRIGQNALNTYSEEGTDPIPYCIKSNLADAPKPRTTKELSVTTGIPVRSLSRELARLAANGAVTRDGQRGRRRWSATM